MNTNKPTVTEADRKCAESVLKKCVYQAGDTDPEAAAAVIAAHRVASNAEAKQQADWWMGRALNAEKERDAANQRAERWRTVAIILANSVTHGIHSGIAEYHALYAEDFAASEQASQREGGK